MTTDDLAAVMTRRVRPLAVLAVMLAATLALLGAACSQVRSLGSDRPPGDPSDESENPSASASTDAAAARAPALIDETGPENPAGLSPGEVTELLAGGSAADMRFLYPYEGTVFPGGTVAPLAMWTGSNATPDVVYLRMKSQDFEYKGVLKPGVTGALFQPDETVFVGPLNLASAFMTEPNKQVAIPQAAWNAAAQRTLGRGDALLIEVTERAGGRVFGPISTRVTIARGSLQGSIYYNSCFSGMAGDPNGPVGVEGLGARILRIPAGGHAETVSERNQCVGCHTVSANGARMVAQRSFTVADVTESVTTGTPVDDYTHALTMTLSIAGAPEAQAATRIGKMGAYGALYPDGSRYLAASAQMDAGALSKMGSVDIEEDLPLEAGLIDTNTGMPIANTGIPPAVTMPMFSPDGTRLVFNDASIGGGSTLAVMDYDVRADRARARRMLVDLGDADPLRPGWPFFLPDSQAVIFVQTDSPDFSATGPATDKAASDLYIADVESGRVTLLARAMGFETPEDAAANRTYLPFGEDDLHHNYYPTVAPVATGGYFWVFFDSRRHFGSLGEMRMLWGAAIDIRPDGVYTTDPSHPPFYVSGQEFLNTSHFRAFAALDRCLPDGEACESGMDCCAGACSDGACAAPAADACAELEESCQGNADCCGPESYCINGFCSFSALL